MARGDEKWLEEDLSAEIESSLRTCRICGRAGFDTQDLREQHELEQHAGEEWPDGVDV